MRIGKPLVLLPCRVYIDLVIIHLLLPPPPVPSTPTCPHTLLCTLAPTQGADSSPRVQPRGFPQLERGAPPAWFCFVSAALAQAGLVTICGGKAQAWPGTTSAAPAGPEETWTQSRHPAVPERACFTSTVLSHKETDVHIPLLSSYSCFFVFIAESFWEG